VVDPARKALSDLSVSAFGKDGLIDVDPEGLAMEGFDAFRELTAPLREKPVVTHNKDPLLPKFAPIDAEEEQAMRDLRQYVIDAVPPEFPDGEQILETVNGPIKLGAQDMNFFLTQAITTLIVAVFENTVIVE